MTDRSPTAAVLRLWITGLGTTPESACADARTDPPPSVTGAAGPLHAIQALQALRAGERDMALINSYRPPHVTMLIENSAEARRRGILPYAEQRGVAMTHESDHAHPDPLDHLPARTIRRALADGRLKAADIGYVFVETAASTDQARRVGHAVERGLGRWAADVVVETAGPGAAMCVVAVALTHTAGTARFADAEPAVAELAARVGATLRPGAPAGAVLLMLGAGRANTALAFSAPR